MFYAVMVAGSVATISEVIGEIQRAAGATERLIELVDTPIDIPTVLNPVTLPASVMGQLVLKDVRFTYQNIQQGGANDDLAEEVIRGLTVHIQAGERVALVGESGAGKSTLFELLQRFYTLKSGVIELDGIDIAQLSPQDLRQQYALVPQDSVIFAMSVLENVRYGRLDNWTPYSLISYVISQFSRDFGVQNERYYYWR